MKAQLAPHDQQLLLDGRLSVSSEDKLEGDVELNTKKFHSEDSNTSQIYWKSNHLLTEDKQVLNFVGVEQLEDKIQQNFLREHGSVINYQAMKLLNELENQGCQDDISQNTLDNISDNQFANYFFEFLIQNSIFDSYEASQFKNMLQKRKDWRKLCADLFSSISRKLYWQLTYIFYLCIHLLAKFQTKFKLTPIQLEKITKTYIEQNQNILKNKLYYIGQSSEMNVYLQKIVYTILLLLNGFFVNKCFEEIDDQDCIRCSPNIHLRPKKIKLVDFRLRCQCHRPLYSEKPPKKKNKIARNSI